MNIFRRNKKGGEMDLDEIFLDSINLPDFDDQQFEGRIEKPISKRAIFGLSFSFVVILSLFTWQIGHLQIARGEAFAQRASSNSLKHIPVFPARGIILDRNGVELASNAPTRTYIEKPGFAHVLGYVGKPSEVDLKSQEAVHTEELVGKAGVEESFNDRLRGVSGLKIAEVDVHGVVQSENVYRPPVPGEPLALSIDSVLQEKLYGYIKSVADERGFSGGAGVVMDVRTGEVVAMTSYPEYSPQVMSDGTDKATIRGYLSDSIKKPFLNRAISGIYTPGSILKPIIAAAALAEKIISPEKSILSTGSISIQNPYDRTQKTVFKDWKAHGWVNMRRALAVSSDVYFYAVGGGYEDQKGIGILNIDKYSRMFGLGSKTGIEFSGEGVGVIPNPEWKAANFDGEPWRIGNTYHSSIGQYGFGVTPLQMVRSVAAVAMSGAMPVPTILKLKDGEKPKIEKIEIDAKDFQIVREGMRQAVTAGTAAGLSIPQVQIAGKTGTAELGASKQRVNSWVEGFFPYENPKYAFVVLMENGSVKNTVGGVYVMRQFMDWVSLYADEYVR